MSLFLDTFLGKNRIYPFRIFLNITLSDGSYQSFLLFGVNLLTGLSTRGTIAIFLKIHGQSHTYFEKNEMKSRRLIDFFLDSEQKKSHLISVSPLGGVYKLSGQMKGLLIDPQYLFSTATV